MAEKRMFAKSIIDTDLFLEMPLTTQALYFHLSLRADDEGFVNAPKKIMRMIGASEDDIKILITKQFLIPFDSGVVVIKHWRIHNYIQKDRFKATFCTAERKLLSVEKSGVYSLDTKCIQDVSKMDTQNRIDKNRLDKISIDKNRIEEEPVGSSVGLSVSQLSNLYSVYGEDVVNAYVKKMELFQNESHKKYKTPFETLKSWLEGDTAKPKKKKPKAGNERDYSEDEMEDLERKLLNN